MSQAGPAPSQKLVTELKVSGHLMTLEKGLFCIFHAAGSAGADPQTGLPGVRITHPPLQDKSRISISSFNDDGWIGAEGSAALVRINEGPSQLLVTIYQNGAGQHDAPKLQVMRLGDVSDQAAQAASSAPAPLPDSGPVVPPSAPAAAEPAPAPVEGAEVAAHVQRRGDKLGKLGEWMGEPGSQSWIEGFAIAPNRQITPEDIEYQAVLGKGWLSPWSDGGQYCGSRGMALPILGLRVRLKGRAADSNTLRVSATFTDGSRVGPVSEAETAEAESLAPLEAFRIEILPREGGAEPGIDASDDQPEAATIARDVLASAGRVAPRRISAPAAPVAVKAASKPGAKPQGQLQGQPLGKSAGKPAGKPAARKTGHPARR